ncbi:MAG: formate dehydrogenase subunit gamma [Microvirga sp.]
MSKPALWDKARGEEIVADLARRLEGAALPMLHALQEAFGHVPEEALPLIASSLNLSRAEVHGIVTFYRDFRRTPPGAHVLRICRAEACQAVGVGPLAEAWLEREGLGWGETTSDGRLTIEGVYCLGLCACGPAALFDGEPIARLDRERLDALRARAGTTARQGGRAEAPERAFEGARHE